MYTYIYNPVQLASIILSIIGQKLSIIRQCLVWQLHVSNMALDLLNIVHLNNSCIPPFSLLPSSSFLPPPSSPSLSPFSSLSLLPLSCRLTLSPSPSHSLPLSYLTPSPLSHLIPSPRLSSPLPPNSSPLKFVK